MIARVPGVGFAVATAFAMIAYQVGAKATRDALFLALFPVSALPTMTIASALLSIVLAFAAARALARHGPEMLVPLGFVTSATLLFLEWALVGPWPRAAAIAVYLHYGAFGALLISGFWAFLNERFDPRTTKRAIGQVTIGGTLGGLAGGVLAERVGAVLPVATMLPLLALLHLACALFVVRLRRETPPLDPGARAEEASEDDAPMPARPAPVTATAFRVFAESPYLRTLVAIVVLVTVSEGLIDWIFKARVADSMSDGAAMLRLFAAFYTGVALLTVGTQALLSRPVLERLGPARTAGLLPVITGLGSLGALAWPGLPSTIGLRASESVLGNSLYRGGYEVLFTPLPSSEKRAVKPIVDVGASRLGDLVGAAMVQVAVLLVGLAAAVPLLLVVAVAISAAATTVALRLHGGYLRTLERSLLARAVHLDLSMVRDAGTRSMVLRNLGSLTSSSMIDRLDPALTGLDPMERVYGSARTALESDDPLAARAAALSSGRRDDVRRALAEGPLTSELVPQAIALLAWDEVAREAIGALRGLGAPCVDLLVDALCDPQSDFAIRRRAPLVLGTIAEPASAAGLLRGLADRRFEVRYRCGRALSHLVQIRPELGIAPDVALKAVLREVGTERRVWDNQRILDHWDDDAWSPLVDDALRSRANRSLEHVFTLLSFALPHQPLRLAFRGLQTDDPLLRGTALEYLETSLPPEVRAQLWPYLDDDRTRRAPARSPAQALADLLQSGESIRIRLDELREVDADR